MALISRLVGVARAELGFLKAHPAHMVAVVGALAAGSLAGLPVADEAYTYLWADYRFCDDCHVHDYANQAYERSVHFGMTTCHDCHLVPIRHYPRNLYVTVFDPPQSADDIHRPDVQNVICTRCHSAQTDDEPLTGPMPEEVRRTVVKIDDSPMHRLHLQSKTRDPGVYRGGGKPHGQGEEHTTEHAIHGVVADWDAGQITCMDCHGAESNRAHTFDANTANCVACHEGVAPEGTPIAALECRECHFSGFAGKPGELAYAAPPDPAQPSSTPEK